MGVRAIPAAGGVAAVIAFRLKGPDAALGSEKMTGENGTPVGMTAGGLLNAGRQESQSLAWRGDEGIWSPEPSAEQMTANGSKPKWPAGMKPENRTCSAIA